MVAVTGAPGNAAVIRRAARIAARVKAPLIAINVVWATRSPPRGAPRSSRSSSRRWVARGRRCGATTWPRRSSPPPSTSRSRRSSSEHRADALAVGDPCIGHSADFTMASKNDIDLHVIAVGTAAGRPVADDQGQLPPNQRRRRPPPFAPRAACTCRGAPAPWRGGGLGPGTWPRRPGPPSRPACQGKDGLVHDVLIGSIADTAIDRPGDAGRFTCLGDTGGLHVDGAAPPRGSGATRRRCRRAVGRHQPSRGRRGAIGWVWKTGPSG